MKNLCLSSDQLDEKPVYLDRVSYIEICNSFVEHIGDVNHSFQTVLQVVEALVCIGCHTKFGNVAVCSIAVRRFFLPNLKYMTTDFSKKTERANLQLYHFAVRHILKKHVRLK